MTTSQTTFSEFRKAEEDNFKRGVRLRDEGRLEDSLGVFQEIADRCPNVLAPFMMVGWLNYELSRLTEAESAFRRAVELNPRKELATRGLFHTLWDFGKEVEAISVIKRYTELTGSDAFKDMLEHYREARESGPDSPMMLVVNLKGKIGTDFTNTRRVLQKKNEDGRYIPIIEPE